MDPTKPTSAHIDFDDFVKKYLTGQGFKNDIRYTQGIKANDFSIQWRFLGGFWLSGQEGPF